MTVVQNHVPARARHQNLVLDPARGPDDLSDTKFDGTAKVFNRRKLPPRHSPPVILGIRFYALFNPVITF